MSWRALEDAGQAPDRLFGSPTGVFIGIGGIDYPLLQARSGCAALLDAYYATGFAHSVASGRLSYVLGLQGPSISVDTACSSSLVAVHLACQSLRTHECRLALAGGVNLILGPDIHISLSKARMMAADGRCKAFDAAADGFVRAEGCGVVVLKRLSDALSDGDRIRAVIKGSAVNQDGRSSGLTAPNGPSQEAVIRAALHSAGIDAGRLQYVEAHGTGTALGDPIEARALAAVLADAGSTSRVRIGSVKTNIGHAEAAAGRGGPDQGRTGAGPRRDSAAPALQPAQPADRLEPDTARGGDRANALAGRAVAAGRRRQLVRLQRHERPCHRRGGAGAPLRRLAVIERPLHLLTLSAQEPRGTSRDRPAATPMRWPSPPRGSPTWRTWPMPAAPTSPIARRSWPPRRPRRSTGSESWRPAIRRPTALTGAADLTSSPGRGVPLHRRGIAVHRHGSPALRHAADLPPGARPLRRSPRRPPR